MSYLFSHSSSSRPISIPSSNLSAARAQLSAALLSMGFPHARVQPLVALINPTQDNAIEVALELLTREEEDDDDNDDEQQQGDELRGRGLRMRRQRAMRRTAGRDAEDEDEEDAVGVLMAMTGCSAEEASAALHRERDVNAAAEYILQKQEHKEAAAVMTAEQAQQEELQRDERRLRRRQHRREKAELYRKIEEEQDSSAGSSVGLRRFLHYGDAVIVQHVQSEEALTLDSESNRVTFTAYSSSAPLTGASPQQQSAASAAVTSPLALPASQHSSGLSRASPGAAVPTPLQLSSLSSSSPPASSRSLLSSSPVRLKAQGSSGGALPPSSSWSSAFLPPSPLRVTSLSSVPPTAASQASPSSHSVDRLPFANHSLSPLHSPIKSRSVSTPRKSSHPLSFSLPSHHRYQLIIRPAPGLSSPLAAGEGGEGGDADGDGGLVMSGDTVVLETYERCFLCLEADGSIGCNRTAPITAQMHFTLHAEQKTADGRQQGTGDANDGGAAKDDGEDAEAEREEAEDDDIIALEPSSLLLLSSVDHHWLGVERQQAVARHSRSSAAHRFSLTLAHKPASHHRRHTRSQSSSSPLQSLLPGTAASASASASSSAPVSGSAAHWSYLRRHFRLIAMSMLHESIRRKQDTLIAAQRAARLRGEDAKRLCCICLDAQCDAVLLECGHSCACQACAAELQQCVVCRQRVSRVIAIRAV